MSTCLVLHDDLDQSLVYLQGFALRSQAVHTHTRVSTRENLSLGGWSGAFPFRTYFFYSTCLHTHCTALFSHISWGPHFSRLQPTPSNTAPNNSSSFVWKNTRPRPPPPSLEAFYDLLHNYYHRHHPTHHLLSPCHLRLPLSVSE